MKEEEIRPQKLFDRYLELCEKDIKKFFNQASLNRITCPGCGSENYEFAFQKMGFDYDNCLDCETLFVNPRPEAEAFFDYYHDSPSVRFWATHFYRETEKARRKAIIQPKAEMINKLMVKFISNKPLACIADIGAGYGVFCEEIKKLVDPQIPIIAIEPANSLGKVCQEKGLTLIPKFIEDMDEDDLPKGGTRVATCFELLEHIHDPELFLNKVNGILGDGGILFLTTLNGLGFDVQILWQNSKSIHPPHHINFFNPKSVHNLFERTGFEILDISTPGKLDVDIASKQIEFVSDRYIQKILRADEEIKDKFQLFLQEAKMSSHMLLVVKVK